MKKSVVEIVSELLRDFFNKNGYELYDVEFVKEGSERYLRVFVDKDPSVTVDDCEVISKYLSAKLDEHDPIKEHYYLEVSSPGAEREFRKESDYQKYIGHQVMVYFLRNYQGVNSLRGKLLEKTADSLTIEFGKKPMVIPMDVVHKVKNLLEI